MALILCAVCGHKISSRANRCPKCGERRGDNNPGPDSCLSQTLETSLQPEASAAQPPQPEKPQDTEEWYFVTPLGRNGPVTFEFIQMLAIAGQISNDTKIWKAGLPDWVKFSQYKGVAETTHPPEPPAIPGKPLSNAFIWTLALAPAWGVVVQIIATEARIIITHKTLDYYAQMWWIVIACNIIFSYLDMRFWNKFGRADEKVDGWLCLLVPLYIYNRDKFADAGMKRFWIWVGSALLSIAVLLSMNNMYSQISSR